MIPKNTPPERWFLDKQLRSAEIYFVDTKFVDKDTYDSYVDELREGSNYRVVYSNYGRLRLVDCSNNGFVAIFVNN